MNKIKFLLVAMMIAMCAFAVSCSADDPTTTEQFLASVKGRTATGSMGNIGTVTVTFSDNGKTLNFGMESQDVDYEFESATSSIDATYSGTPVSLTETGFTMTSSMGTLIFTWE